MVSGMSPLRAFLKPFTGLLLAFLLTGQVAASQVESAAALPPLSASSSTQAADSGTSAATESSNAAPQAGVKTLPLELEWQLDPAGKFLPDELLSPTQQNAFTLFHFTTLPREAGTFWFRFRPNMDQEQFRQTWVLDLNSRVTGQLPETPRVFIAPAGAATLTELKADFPGLYSLPASAADGTIYIRAAGSPGPGFAPVLRENTTLNILDSDGPIWVRTLLGLCLLLCLIRGLAERREWRMWAALFVGAALVQVFWGLPGTHNGLVNLMDLPGLLAPGVALLILPHVGRHLMRSRTSAPGLDVQLILLTLPGLLFSLVPLLPGYTWTIRFLPLWPVGMLLLFPSLAYAALRKLPGVRRFFLVCLFPPLGLVAMLPHAFSFTAPLPSPEVLESFQALLPWAGLCLSAVLVAAMPTPKAATASSKNARTPAAAHRQSSGKNSWAAANAANAPLELAPASVPFEPTSLSLPEDAASDALRLDLLEKQLRAPLDTILNELSILDQIVTSRESRRHLETLAGAARRLTRQIGGAVSSPSSEVPSAAPSSEVFDLRRTLRAAHDAVAEKAESRNISLSWYAAPHLGQYYQGDKTTLLHALIMLAESSVRATDRGMVQLRVQRVPASNDPGQLLFTVTDTGSGEPPFGRTSMALVRAWELAAAEGGSLSMESSPTGTSITFSLRLQAVQSDGLKTAPVVRSTSPRRQETPFNALRILVISDVPGTRELLAYYLDELPHEVIEARSAAEALSMYSHAPGALLIFDGDLPEEDIVHAVAGIRAIEGEQNYPLASILALVIDEEQAERLLRAGCTHVLHKPLSRTELRQSALRLAPLPKKRSPSPRLSAPAAASEARDAAQQSVDGSHHEDPKQPGNLLPPSAPVPPQGRKARERAEAPGRSEKALSKPMFSNVGEPMPIPKTTNSETEARRRDKAAGRGSESFSDRSKAPARPTVPAPAGSGRVADPVEWVGEPMPIPSKKAAADVAASDATPCAALKARVGTGPHADNPPAITVPSSSSLDDTPAVSSAPASAPEVRVVRRPLRTTGASGHRAENEAEDATRSNAASGPQHRAEKTQRGFLRSVLSAVGLGRRHQPPEQPLVSPSFQVDEWVGEPMPISKVRPNPPVAGQTDEPASAPEGPVTRMATPEPDEWVGDPVPIPQNAVSAAVPGEGACEEVDVWVGEPMPVPKAPPTPQDEMVEEKGNRTVGADAQPALLPDPEAVPEAQTGQSCTPVTAEAEEGTHEATDAADTTSNPANAASCSWDFSSNAASAPEAFSSSASEERLDLFPQTPLEQGLAEDTPRKSPASAPELSLSPEPEAAGANLPEQETNEAVSSHEPIPEWTPLEMPHGGAVTRPLSLLSMLLPEEPVTEDADDNRPGLPPERLPLPGMDLPDPEIITLTEKIVVEGEESGVAAAALLTGEEKEPWLRERPADGTSLLPPPTGASPAEAGSVEPADREKAPGEETLPDDTDARFAALLSDLREAYEAGRRSHDAADIPSVHAAADDLARAADALGLRDLSELAVYLEEAAQSGDLDAVNGLLSDIRKAVERNTQTL